MIDNYRYRSNNTASSGRARPPPRHGGAAGRRHADHAPARRRLSQPQHPTGLPGARRRLDAWRGAAPVDDASLAAYLGELFEAGRAPATAALGRRRRPVSGHARRPAGPRRGSDRPRVGRLPSHGRHRRGRLDAVIASLLFMGGLRRSEVSALEWRDVSDARDGDGVLLTVRTSKTNQEGDAADVRYLKNGAAKAIRTLRAAGPTPPPRIG